MSGELFDDGADEPVLLGGFASDAAWDIVAAVRKIEAKAPFRRMVTPAGLTMSVAMTNCGEAGWVTDRTGYRYDARDPESGKPWPAMPDLFRNLAARAAAAAGWTGYAEAGFGYDTNANVSTAQGSVFVPSLGTQLILDRAFVRDPDAFTELAAGAEYAYPLSGTLAVLAGAGLRLRSYRELTTADELNTWTEVFGEFYL